jgi:drug/metabolite transporter (DMT)-like permease
MSLPVIVLFAASVLWGLSWSPLKTLHNAGFGGISLVFLSFGVLSLALFPILTRQHAKWKVFGPQLLLIALFGGAANLAFAYAMIVGDVVRVMVLFYLLPVWGVLGGRLILKERIDAWRWTAVTLALVGAFIVLGGFKVWAQPPSWIDFIALLSGLFFALNNLVFRALQGVPVASKVSAMCWGCFILAGLTLLVTSENFSGPSTVPAWYGLAAYALVWMMAAHFGSQWGVSNLEVSRSSIIIIAELITAVVSTAIILDKMLTPAEAVGGVLIVGAALMEALRNEKPADLAFKPGL